MKNTEIQQYMQLLGQQAKVAAQHLAASDTQTKNAALLHIADAIHQARDTLHSANQRDLAAGAEKGLDAALLDRLELTKGRVDSMLEGLQQIAALPDPIGEIFDMKNRPSGIQVGRMRVPLGVIGIIYESRPNVTADAAALCLKSGNATVLRGGSEAFHSNQAIAVCIQQGLAQAGLPPEAVQVVNTTDRQAVEQMITMPDSIDVIIPRGGKGLIKRISDQARVPVIKHLDGICHLYVDDAADRQKAFDVALNSKTQRYGTCNTLETLLVHHAIAAEYLPGLAAAYREKGVELRGCAQTCALLGEVAVPATEEDWDTEYLAPILSIRVVDDMAAAIAHINTHGSKHTDSIMTENFTRARKFLQQVDASSVMVNTSTRFADGFEYGLGAEIGISTDKLHARGPVALEGLTSVKFIVFGDGHVRV